MGFGDLFIAAVLGALLARDSRLQLRGALLAAFLCCAWDLLFFAIKTTPATVPVALTLLTLELWGRWRSELVATASTTPKWAATRISSRPRREWLRSDRDDRPRSSALSAVKPIVDPAEPPLT